MARHDRRSVFPDEAILELLAAQLLPGMTRGGSRRFNLSGVELVRLPRGPYAMRVVAGSTVVLSVGSVQFLYRFYSGREERTPLEDGGCIEKVSLQCHLGCSAVGGDWECIRGTLSGTARAGNKNVVLVLDYPDVPVKAAECA